MTIRKQFVQNKTKMKLLNQNIRDLTQTDFSYEGIMKFVEKIGRICYDSSDKITDDSWKSFVEKLRKNKHFSPFGHATAYLKIPKSDEKAIHTIDYISNSYHRRIISCSSVKHNYLLVVCSVRCLEETKFGYSKSTEKPTWNILKKYLVDPNRDELFEDWDPRRQSFLCNTSISVTRELNRHGWNLDIMEKSTRYTECFDIIKPYWYDTQKWYAKFLYKMTCKIAFINYKILLKLGLKKQESRGVLPLDTATQVIYTAFNYQWQDIFDKRLASGVHPDCRKLVGLIHENINFD